MVSLLCQSTPPLSVTLFVSHEAFLFDSGVRMEDFLGGLHELEATSAFRIAFVPNTGPYRKLVPALLEPAPLSTRPKCRSRRFALLRSISVWALDLNPLGSSLAPVVDDY